MDTVTHLLPKFQSRLTTAIDADDVSIVLESVTGIPAVPFMAILDDSKSTAECVWVTAVTTVSKTLTVTRAQRGTTAVEHVIGTLLYHSEIPLGDLGFFETWETAGETGRPLESKLITDVLLGGWANGIKGYVDCNDSGGSTGLLSGINGEIRLPNAAGRGAYFALEGEVVAQEDSRITPWGSSAGFLWLGISGHADGVGDFDDDGRFMGITGLTPLADHLLSADSQTLKCTFEKAGAYTDRYLVLSQSQNIVHTNVAALADAGNMAKFTATIATPAFADGYGAFEVQLDVSGIATGQVNAASMWINLGASSEIPGYMALRNDGIYDAGATLTTAYVSMQKFQNLLASNPAWLSIWELNHSGAHSEIDAIFNCNDPTLALGYQAGTPTKAAVGSIPFCSTAGGSVRYIYLYDEADAD